MLTQKTKKMVNMFTKIDIRDVAFVPHALIIFFQTCGCKLAFRKIEKLKKPPNEFPLEGFFDKIILGLSSLGAAYGAPIYPRIKFF